MLKNRFLICLFVYLVIGLFVAAKPAKAANIAITKLPGYINTNDFKLSYSCLGCSSVQFYVNRHGEGWVAFGPVFTTANGQVEVTSSQINDQTDYAFKVSDPIGEDLTTTIYDVSGPSSISDFHKERINDGKYKLSWTNPGDTDFDKVIIYRGDTLGFSADASHEIARVSGGSNSPMTYDDSFSPNPAITYYYLIRALDHVGNSSGLAGDGGTTTTEVVLGASATPAAKKTTTTVALPKEKGTGSVLGTEATPGASALPVASTGSVINTNPGAIKWVLTHKKISLGVALMLLAVSYGIYRASKKNK
jgi:hypothetical protein